MQSHKTMFTSTCDIPIEYPSLDSVRWKASIVLQFAKHAYVYLFARNEQHNGSEQTDWISNQNKRIIYSVCWQRTRRRRRTRMSQAWSQMWHDSASSSLYRSLLNRWFIWIGVDFLRKKEASHPHWPKEIDCIIYPTPDILGCMNESKLKLC